MCIYARREKLISITRVRRATIRVNTVYRFLLLLENGMRANIRKYIANAHEYKEIYHGSLSVTVSQSVVLVIARGDFYFCIFNIGLNHSGRSCAHTLQVHAGARLPYAIRIHTRSVSHEISVPGDK